MWLTFWSSGGILNHMIENVMELDAVFHALANRARRDIVGRLAGCDLTVGELAEPLTMSLAAASKHIKVLERAGLVRQTVEGRQHVCRLEAEPLGSVSGWLLHYQQFWTERLDAMEALFGNDPTATAPSTGVPAIAVNGPTLPGPTARQEAR